VVAVRDFEEFARLLVAKRIIIGYSKVLKQVYVADESKVAAVAKVLDEGGYGDYKVIVTGEFRALSETPPLAQPPPRTGKIRPLVAGISFGHRDITAGTLSGLADDGTNYYLISNAHIVHPYPLSPYPPHNKGVWQPGPYDTAYDYANENEYKVAEYYTHVRVRSIYDYSTCPITRGLNALYKALGRHSFIITQTPNYVDVGLAKLLGGVPFEKTTYAVKYQGFSDELLKKPFIGLLFAGTQAGHAAICKVAKYWKKYFPNIRIAFPEVLGEDVTIDNVVVKDGRTSGLTIAGILDPAAAVAVGYGLDIAWFEDVILTTTDAKASGGDSGSPTWIWK
jgi:hypothetical protein